MATLGDTSSAQSVTAAGLALLDDAAASDQRTTLGLGTLATQSGTFSGTSSGTNTGDQTVPAFATPAIVLGSAAAAGAASTVIRSDGTIAAFDATVPTTQAFGDAAAVGTAAFAARRDHKHAMMAAPAASALVLLEQYTASSSATLDFTTCISATYDEYQIELLNVLPATTNTNLLARVSTDGGSTYVATGSYDWADAFGYASTAGAEGAAAATAIQVAGQVKSTGIGVCGSLRLLAPGASGQKALYGPLAHTHNSVGILARNLASAYTPSTVVNAFRFLYSSGNIASGIIRVYGVAKT